MAEIDFLSPDINQIRQSIKGIDESYSHDWDILAELTQNSVDAIRQKGLSKGLIKLTIDKDNKSISVYDNGIGMKHEEMPCLLRPFSTGKHGRGNLVGEKGVGLKFAIFSGNYFRIQSINSSTKAVVEIFNAFDWKNSDNLDKLPLRLTTEESNAETYTEMKIGDIKNEAIFKLTYT